MVDSTLFIATEGDGVLVYTIGKSNLAHSENTGLSPNALFSYSLIVKGTNIYVGTSNGIWKRPLSEIITVAPKNSLNNFLLYQNYPNPFNPTTNIDIKFPKFDLFH